MLYYEGTSGNFRQSVALGGYYLLAFDFGCNPLLVSWMVANTAGQTKKSAIMSLYQAGSAAGNIIGMYEYSTHLTSPLRVHYESTTSAL